MRLEAKSSLTRHLVKHYFVEKRFLLDLAFKKKKNLTGQMQFHQNVLKCSKMLHVGNLLLNTFIQKTKLSSFLVFFLFSFFC